MISHIKVLSVSGKAFTFHTWLLSISSEIWKYIKKRLLKNTYCRYFFTISWWPVLVIKKKIKLEDYRSWYFSQFPFLRSDFYVNGVFMALCLYGLVAKLQLFQTIRCTVPVDFGGNWRSVFVFIFFFFPPFFFSFPFSFNPPLQVSRVGLSPLKRSPGSRSWEQCLS